MMNVARLAILLLSLVAPAATLAQSGLCPTGSESIFNVNEPGCTFCYAATDCQPLCLGPPACFCPPGDVECCAATPCCENCPEPKPLSCETSRCTCAPEGCCSTVCPSSAPAPVGSAAGLGLLVLALVALGAGAVRFGSRRA